LGKGLGFVGWERGNNRTMDENRANWEI